MKFVGISYGRGACKNPLNDGCENGPDAIAKMFPDVPFENVTPDWEFCPSDMVGVQNRMTENLQIQKIVYEKCMQIPSDEKYIFVGGDHSLNYAHFKALSDIYDTDDLALVYIDAHMDNHDLTSSSAEASGSPHGMNVRHLLAVGTCDERFLQIGKRAAVLKPENLFYMGTRSFEPSEETFAFKNKLFYSAPKKLVSVDRIDTIIDEILSRIGDKKFVLSFDFDCIDPKDMPSVQVPEPDGLQVQNAKHILNRLMERSSNIAGVEFVEFAPRFDVKNIGAGNAQELIDIVLQGWK